MADFRGDSFDSERMLHLRAHTFAPLTEGTGKPLKTNSERPAWVEPENTFQIIV